MTKFIILFCSLVISISVIYGQTPVEQHGQLRVEGNKIFDKNGEPVQLRGMSMFWSQWDNKYYKRSLVDWLVTDWKISIIRAEWEYRRKIADI